MNFEERGWTPVAVRWLQKNCDWDDEGVIAFKVFGLHYDPPEEWKIEVGATLTNRVLREPRYDCGYGINVCAGAWFRWVSTEALLKRDMWVVRVPWDAIICVPERCYYNHLEDKFRASKIVLLENLGHCPEATLWTFPDPVPRS